MRKYAFILSICLAAISCGSLKTVNYKQTFSDIREAESRQDISALIRYAYNFPEYEDYISSYLMSGQDLSRFSYSELIEFKRQASGMPVIEEDLRYIIKSRQLDIESTLSRISFAEQGTYYLAHPDESQYIDSLYRERLIPTLDEWDYVSLRDFSRAFIGTGLQKDIDRYYLPFRDSLWVQVEENLEDYFEMEDEALEALKTDILVQLESYTQESVNQIVSYLIDHKLPWIKSNVNNRADEIVELFYDQEYANQIIVNALHTYVKDVHMSRELITRQLLEGVQCDSPAPLIEFGTASFSEANLKLPYGAFMKLRDAQRKIDWFSVGLTAASFTVAWPAGLLLDVADLAYGIHSDRVKEAAIKEEFNNFIPVLYDNLTRKNEMTVENTFRNLSLEVTRYQLSYKDYVKKYF